MFKMLCCQVSKGPPQHKDIQFGLLYNILMDPGIAAKVSSVDSD